MTGVETIADPDQALLERQGDQAHEKILEHFHDDWKCQAACRMHGRRWKLAKKFYADKSNSI